MQRVLFVEIGRQYLSRSVRGGGGIAPHSPRVKQLTRRNCPLLNCESVLWGIEADGQRPRRSPCASKKRKPKSRPCGCRLATYMTRNGLIATCFVCLLIAATGRAHGLDPSKRLTQYRHNVWRIQDGFFPGGPILVSQTADSYLWVGTRSEAFRFDGVRFVPWSPPASASKATYFFVPAKNGGFWIIDGLGLSHIRGNRIVSHINVGAPARRTVEEEDGSLWVTTRYRPGLPGPLCHATDREVRCFGKADGLPIQRGDSILSDGTGGVWIGSDTSLVHWKAGVSEIYEPQALRSNSGQEGIRGLVRNSDGSLWVYPYANARPRTVGPQ
jgi:ligand-binding sensor domain-containing protein